MRNACDLCSFNATCNFYALFTLITLYSLYKLYISSIYENYFSCIECWLILFLLITIYFVYDSVFLALLVLLYILMSLYILIFWNYLGLIWDLLQSLHMRLRYVMGNKKSQRNMRTYSLKTHMERTTGLEPALSTLARSRFTN